MFVFGRSQLLLTPQVVVVPTPKADETRAGQYLVLMAGGGYSGDGGPAKGARLRAPSALALSEEVTPCPATLLWSWRC